MTERLIEFQNNKQYTRILKNTGYNKENLNLEEQILILKAITKDIILLLSQLSEMGLNFKDDTIFKSSTEMLLRGLSERIKKHCEDFEEHSLLDNKSSANENYKVLEKVIGKIETAKNIPQFLTIISDKKFFEEVNVEVIKEKEIIKR